MSPNDCAACGHTHSGRGLAFICVGCPCPETPGKTAPSVTQPISPAHPPHIEIERLKRVIADLDKDLIAKAAGLSANALRELELAHERTKEPYLEALARYGEPVYGRLETERTTSR